MEYAFDDVPETDLDDINGHIHSAVEGFFEKYFRDKSWSPAVEEIARDADGFLGCDVLECLSTSLCLSWGGRHVFQYTFSTQLDESAPGLRLLLTRPESRPNQEYGWATVQVVGRVQTDTRAGYVRGLLHLCDYARLVFTSQPTRLFLHGFYVFGSTMELWMFDRSGMYSSEPFDVCSHLDRLTTIVAGYSRMSDEELGINPIVRQDEEGKYVMAKGGDNSEVYKLYLESCPLARPDNIFSQAPTCYQARRSDAAEREFVVKFSWRSDMRRPEEKILQQVKEREVWGLVQLFSHQEVESISNLRRGLRFESPKDILVSTAAAPDAEQSTVNTTYVGGIGRWSIDVRAKEGAGDMNDVPFKDLKLFCLAVSPFGYSIARFDPSLEFLEGFRDAIKAHRSLYLDGNILHQDISKNNIMIPAEPKEGEPRGFLIDLDLSMDLAIGPARPDELNGTKAFMAIDLLKGEPHTYRHDLESFFYVFLWIAICGGNHGLPDESRLQGWQAGRWIDMARRKTEDMSEGNFDAIVSEFLPSFKRLHGLAYRLREVVFRPGPDGSLFTGTETGADEVERLYADMIQAFEDEASRYREPALRPKI